ncbi:hypothetical protein M8542_14385 [Amycolatopsis sp. OK19-0408]|uniref:DUF3040 domain-containing protein n=1 Tax=Amycolatopsis iheyensis TaxID=2945988 RepID=A0A9X2NC54_9PSEU|nr:hypothetical protein [Amycolatopsis iheyensis]MCR6484009.1 hypothetical protein [Amycolatopsis iheyensis]
MTVQPDIGKTPDKEGPHRVKVVAKHGDDVRPRRIASRDEMLAAADRVMIRRGLVRRRRFTGDNWLCLAMAILAGWAPTLRVCLLLAVAGGIIVAVFMTSGPAVGASLSTLVGGLSLLGAWAMRPRRGRVPSL